MAPQNQNVVRVAFVSRLPAPYREPLLARFAAESGIELRVLYAYAGRSGTAWPQGERHRHPIDTRVCHEDPDAHSGTGAVASALRWAWRELSRFRPRLVILHGYNFPAAIAAWVWCRVHRCPYALRADSNPARTVAPLRRLPKRVVVGMLVRHTQSVLVIGTANRTYWERYGARPSQYIDARYTVDPHPFATACADGDAVRGRRAELGAGNGRVFLFVGRLIPRKHARELCEAFERFVETHPEDLLVVAGDGPQREDVHASARRTSRIVHLGQVAHAELPAIFAAADVLVCPYESEPWGLTLNEGLAAGLALVAPDGGTCGAALDLLRDGENGVALHGCTRDAILDGLQRVPERGPALDAMRSTSRTRADAWTPEHTLHGFLEAVRRAVPRDTTGPRHPTDRAEPPRSGTKP